MRSRHVTSLIKNATSLIVSGAGSALIGLGFWALAAHRAPARFVGRASAELAVMSLLSILAQLSFGVTFERFLPVAGPRAGRFVRRAYIASSLSAIAIATAYVSLHLSASTVPRALEWRVLFVVATVLWTIFSLQEPILVGLREARWVPVQSMAFSTAKLVLLPLFLSVSSQYGIFVAWNAPVIAIVLAVNWILFTKRIPAHEIHSVPHEPMPSPREMLGLTVARYVSQLITVMEPSIVAFIVISRLGPVANAHYYLTAQIAWGAILVLNSISRSFVVEASTDPQAFRRHTRTALRAGLIVTSAIVVGGLIAAPWVLRIFGPEYAAKGTLLMRLIIIALPGYAVSIFYSAFAWLDRRVWWMTARDLFSLVVYLGVILALIGRLGINAVGVASVVEAGLLGIFFLPRVVRRYRAAVIEDADVASD